MEKTQKIENGKFKIPIALPVSIERSDSAGKVFLNDDNGNWLADVHSRHADEIECRLNASAIMLSTLRGIHTWLMSPDLSKSVIAACQYNCELAIKAAHPFNKTTR